MHQPNHHVIQQFWAFTNQGDWDGLSSLLHPEMFYYLPQTRERIRGREGLLDLFRNWPGDWICHVQTLIADEQRAVSTIRFELAGSRDETGISFFEISDGLIKSITEYWPEPYEPPQRFCSYMVREAE